MMKISKRRVRSRGAEAGFSLLEMLISMAVMTAVVGATATAMQQASRAAESAVLVSGLNNSLRTGMDLMTRDMLQVGSGLPPGHVIQVPSGSGAVQMRVPGPPGSAFLTVVGDVDWGAVVPGPGLGPVINGVATDVITVLTVDNNFTDIPLTAISNTTITVRATQPTTPFAPINIQTGVDRILAGQLLMLEKGSVTTFVQVTSVDYGTRIITFANGDSLRLNQTAAAAGNVAALRAADPTPDTLTNGSIPTTATRVRMISYYLDTTVPNHPRLVRRINNGHPTTFNNASGTAVAIDIENLQFTYDLADGTTNPANVRFTAADLAGTGACNPDPCGFNQIRKVNIVMTGRSGNTFARQGRLFRNSLTSQVSLRGMAFVDEYLAP
jgi:prepilin-type N-terminal cleavage/methylation domain-containing protein